MDYEDAYPFGAGVMCGALILEAPWLEAIGFGIYGGVLCVVGVLLRDRALKWLRSRRVTQ